MPRGRPREFDRDKALTDAMMLFWRKGYNATSLRDLCDALEIGMPSLYAAFDSKESLFIEAVDLYMQATQKLLWRHLEENASARDAIRELLFATAQELTNRKAHPVGCMVTTAIIDEDMPAAVAKAIRKARREWVNIIRNRLDKAVADGELPASADIDSLSRFYLGIIQSIAIHTHDGAPSGELEGVIEFAMSAWPAGKPR